MFNAIHMSKSARQAARFNGLSTVAKYEILDYQTKVFDVAQPGFDEKAAIVVIRAYSKSGRKSVDITAGDIFMMESEYQEAPMARVI
jgi:hypothetical protein